MGGAAGSGAGGSLADAGVDAGCNIGCTRQSATRSFGGLTETMWLCTTAAYDWHVLIAGGCEDMATALPRFCCPDNFMSGCS